jgi:hypothetical protein
MTSTDNPPDGRLVTWRVVIGTARGAFHHASGLPNQDAVGREEGPDGAVTVAVADGHGHLRHFRSADGSALAVDIACRVASRTAARLASGTAEEARTVLADMVRTIVADWRSAVAADLAERPYAEQDQSALDLAGDGPEVPYGSTVLVATIAGPWLICAQIGDGDMLGVRSDGGLFYPVAHDDRLDGHRTTSLCQPDAEASFRTGAYDLREVPLAALLLATDGYGNAQTEDPWHPGVGRDLAEFAVEHDHLWFEQQVPGWAERCASSEGSGDDTTIALLLPAEVRAEAEGELLSWTD